MNKYASMLKDHLENLYVTKHRIYENPPDGPSFSTMPSSAGLRQLQWGKDGIEYIVNIVVAKPATTELVLLAVLLPKNYDSLRFVSHIAVYTQYLCVNNNLFGRWTSVMIPFWKTGVFSGTDNN